VNFVILNKNNSDLFICGRLYVFRIIVSMPHIVNIKYTSCSFLTLKPLTGVKYVARRLVHKFLILSSIELSNMMTSFR